MQFFLAVIFIARRKPFRVGLTVYDGGDIDLDRLTAS